MENTPRSALTGIVRGSQHGNVKVHSYISPEDGLFTNTQIVEGPNSLIIFDGQLLLPYAREAASYAKRLAKPAERIVLSHFHLDHWAGLSTFLEHFTPAKIYALPGIAEYLRENGQKIIDARRPIWGNRIPTNPIIPTAVLPEGRATIDGVNFEFRRYLDAEAAIQLVALMPDQGTLLGFDLVFAPDVHVFTLTPHFDNWIRILEEWEALQGYDRILSGHGEPTDRTGISATIAYLRKSWEVYPSARDAEAYAARMKSEFPDRKHPEWIDLAASILYHVVRAYD